MYLTAYAVILNFMGSGRCYFIESLRANLLAPGQAGEEHDLAGGR